MIIKVNMMRCNYVYKNKIKRKTYFGGLIILILCYFAIIISININGLADIRMKLFSSIIIIGILIFQFLQYIIYDILIIDKNKLEFINFYRSNVYSIEDISKIQYNVNGGQFIIVNNNGKEQQILFTFIDDGEVDDNLNEIASLIDFKVIKDRGNIIIHK